MCSFVNFFSENDQKHKNKLKFEKELNKNCNLKLSSRNNF